MQLPVGTILEDEESQREDLPKDSPFGSEAAEPSSAPHSATAYRGEDGHAGVGGSIKVAVRLRPFNEHELQSSTGKANVLEVVDSNTIVVRPPFMSGYLKQDRTFSYDHILSSIDNTAPEYSSQVEVFQVVGAPLVDNAFNAFNGCLLAYGQTGSGKSYSVLGNSDADEDRGVLPRACEEVFEQVARRRLEAEEKNAVMQATILVSYLEIYQDKIRDLFVTTHTDLQVRIHPVLGPHVPSLTECPVTSMNQVRELLDFGSKNRIVATTMMNAQSSRSHAVVTIDLRLSESGKEQQSRIHFVDLAGSEKQKKSDTEGQRLIEGIAINQSLTTLSRCIMALSSTGSGTGRRKSVTQAPFRESKLTLLLKDALSGNSKTSLIACVSPAEIDVEETLGTLEFASRCKLVKTSAKKNEQSKADLVRVLCAEKQLVEEQLQEELEQKQALQERLNWEVQQSKESQELATATEREKREIELQLRYLGLQKTPPRPTERRRSFSDLLHTDFDLLDGDEFLQNHGRYDGSDRLREWKQLLQESRVVRAEKEKRQLLDELEEASKEQERRVEEWAACQQQNEERARQLQNLLRDQEVDREDQERLKGELTAVHHQLQCAREAMVQSQEEAERSRREREEQLRRLEAERAQAEAQVRELKEEQCWEQQRWEALLAEKQLQEEKLLQAREDATEQATKEYEEVVEWLQKEKREELHRVEVEHTEAMGQLQSRLQELEKVQQDVRKAEAEAVLREQELRKKVQVDMGRHEARAEELQRELRDLQALSDSWAAQKQDLESRAQQQRKDRENMLEELGIIGVDADTTATRHVPRLVNLHQDPMLEGCLLYYLPKGDTHVGAGCWGGGVRLGGLDVTGKACTITNHDDRRLIIRATPEQDHLIRVNGALLPSAGRDLQDGDRLAIGRLHAFRVLVPNARRQEPCELEAREEAFGKALQELGHCDGVDARWRARVESAVLAAKAEFGTNEACDFLKRAHAASDAILEAELLVKSAIASAAKPVPASYAPIHDLVVLLEADTPPRLCVVCRCPGLESSLGCATDASGLEDSAAAPGPFHGCSSELWEASRFSSERLPLLREAARRAADAAEDRSRHASEEGTRHGKQEERLPSFWEEFTWFCFSERGSAPRSFFCCGRGRPGRVG